MSKINTIQQKIKSIDGGQFQNLCDDYLQKKYNFKKIIRLGTYSGSSKTTKGIPDTYVDEKDGYTLIMYGHDETNPYSKLEKDIKKIYNYAKNNLSDKIIKKIICCHSSNNISITQNEKLKTICNGVEIELIGIDELSYDLKNNYPLIAKEHLSLELDTGQILSLDDFIIKYDSDSLNAPLSINFIFRNEFDDIYNLLSDSNVLVVTGKPGVGKTKVALEVCSKFCKKNKEYESLYIKSNGLNIYEDLKNYINKDKNYLLYIDDINELRELNLLVDIVNLNKETSKIKVIATVRNYLLESIVNELKRIETPKIYTLVEMNEESIIRLLEEEFSIKNKDYQNKILHISNNNPRIAVMAANGIISKKLKSLNNVLDIYDVYYKDILKKKNISELDLKVLFILGLFLTIDIDSEKQIKTISELFNEKKDIVVACLEKMYKYEIIDFYEGRIFKINDQNFRNYILYYYLIVKRGIKMSSLLELLYSNHIERLLETINMLMNLFYSEETEKYIYNEINKVWEKNKYTNDFNFMMHFYSVNQLKSLIILKKEIDSIESVNYLIKDEDITEKKNYVNIEDKIVKVLCGFKYSEHGDEAIDLLLLYFEKRPDLVINFYFAFTLCYGIDEYSYGNDYKREMNCIEKIADFYSKTSNKNNFIILFLNIARNYLDYEHHITRNSVKKNSIEMLRVPIISSDGLNNFRKKIFYLLSIIYNSQHQYKNKVLNIIKTSCLYSKNEEIVAIFISDLPVLCEYFFNNWTNPNILQSKILERFEIMCDLIRIDKPPCLIGYKKNTKYDIVRIIEYGAMRNLNWKDEENERKNKVLKLIDGYQIKDYDNLFDILSEIEINNEFFDDWKIKSSIQDIFVHLKDCDILINVFESYYLHNVPFSIIPKDIICLLLSKYKKTKIYKLLSKNNSEKVIQYINAYFLNIQQVDKVDVKCLLNFIETELRKDNPLILGLDDILKFEKVSKGIIEKIVSKILARSHGNITTHLFDPIYDSDSDVCNEIIGCFDNVNVLEDAYIQSSYALTDINGYFGLALLKNNKNFALKLVTLLENSHYHSSEVKNIFKNIWEMDKYSLYINLIVEEAYKKNIIRHNLFEVFSKSTEDKKLINNRKEIWIEKFIIENSKDIDKIVFIFEIINECFKSKKKYFVLKFLEVNTNVNDFKKIPLHSYFSSWIGSELPLIDNKINYLTDLSKSINGIEYLEHKAIIDENIKHLERYKEDIKIREYVENMHY